MCTVSGSRIPLWILCTVWRGDTPIMYSMFCMLCTFYACSCTDNNRCQYKKPTWCDMCRPSPVCISNALCVCGNKNMLTRVIKATISQIFRLTTMFTLDNRHRILKSGSVEDETHISQFNIMSRGAKQRARIGTVQKLLI